MTRNLQPLDVVQALYGCVANGDIEGIIALLDPAFVAVEPDSLPYGGRYEGHDGFRAMVAGIGACWSSFAASEFEYIANGHTVAALFRFQATSRATAYQADQRLCEVWQVRDGLIVHCEVFYFDCHAIAANC